MHLYIVYTWNHNLYFKESRGLCFCFCKKLSHSNECNESCSFNETCTRDEYFSVYAECKYFFFIILFNVFVFQLEPIWMYKFIFIHRLSVWYLTKSLKLYPQIPLASFKLILFVVSKALFFTSTIKYHQVCSRGGGGVKWSPLEESPPGETTTFFVVLHSSYMYVCLRHLTKKFLISKYGIVNKNISRFLSFWWTNKVWAQMKFKCLNIIKMVMAKQSWGE